MSCIVISESDQVAPCGGEDDEVIGESPSEFDHEDPSSQTAISLVQTEIGDGGENYDKLNRELNFINGIDHHDERRSNKQTSLWQPLSPQQTQVNKC